MRVGEKRMLKHLLSRTTNAEDHQRYKLFRLIDVDGTLPEDKAKSELGISSSSAFSHLKKRLREDILSVLLIKESSKRIAQANRAAQFECIKKLAQAYVLIFRGAKKEGAEILESARELAIKFELSAEMVSINHLKREALYTFTDPKQLSEVNESLRGDLQRWGDILRSEELSFLITLPQLKEALVLEKGEGFEESMISELQMLYERSGAARVGFWYYMAEVEKCIADGDFDRAISSGVDFLALVEESPAVRSKNNIAGVNQSLGFAYLNLRSYNLAIQHFKQSEKNFPAAGFNRLQCLLFLAQSELASAEYQAVLGTIQVALSHPRIKAREPLVPRWLFIKASTEFLIGNFDAAFKTVNQDGYLLRQQDEWNIQFRLLEMMLLVEMRDEEWLEFKLDATRKFLTRYKKLDTLRVRAAVDILGNLLRRDLDVEELSDKNLQALSNSVSEVEGYEWNPSGMELVRFDLWLKAKLPETDNDDQELDEE